jgi:hypothetical protein
MQKNIIGNYVRYEDYARLKAEVEGLMIFCNCTLIPNKELQAKVERLTKAGDKMADRLMYQGYPETVPAWNAAKKGGQP